MPYQANVLKVMIASPGDVAEERKIVTTEIYRWNDAHAEARKLILQPVKWETHSTPRLGKGEAQAELNEQIAESADILIGIFGTRIGTPTERHVSGTVEEIKNHVAAGKTAKVYFSDAPVQPSTIDPVQYHALQAFKEECKALGLYATYTDIQLFERDFKQHLDIELNAPRYQWLRVLQRASEQLREEVSADSMALLTAAAKGSGIIWIQETTNGDRILGDEKLFTDGTPRSDARWREAVAQLGKLGYVVERIQGVGRYEITAAGYGAADKAERARALHISARIAGAPGKQQLEIDANKTVNLKKIDYLHSTETCIASQVVGLVGSELRVALDYKEISELSNSGRPDKNNYDHSGPVKLRLIFEVEGKPRQMVLAAHLEPKMSGNTQWFTLVGAAETTF
jgi:hypothetical protein